MSTLKYLLSLGTKSPNTSSTSPIDSITNNWEQLTSNWIDSIPQTWARSRQWMRAVSGCGMIAITIIVWTGACATAAPISGSCRPASDRSGCWGRRRQVQHASIPPPENGSTGMKHSRWSTSSSRPTSPSADWRHHWVCFSCSKYDKQWLNHLRVKTSKNGWYFY